MEWNGTGGFQKHQSRESIRAWKDVRRLQEMSETSECRIGKHWSMENIRKHWKHWKMLEMSETLENVRNVRNVRVWNRKTLELECEIGMEI